MPPGVAGAAESYAIFSTATFHWIADHDALFKRLRDLLKPGGRLGAQCGGAGNIRALKDAAERAFLLAKLREANWNVSETARLLDMPRSNLYKKIERYGLAREEA